MKHCKHCDVDIVGDRKKCPLCHTALPDNEPMSEEVYPMIPTVYHQFHILFKILLFVSVLIAIAVITINLIFEKSGLWSIFVVGGVLCVWLSLGLAIRKRRNIPKSILYQVFLISVICVLWDFFTGWNRWSIDYVVPILCASGMISLLLLSWILKWGIENIIVYFCIDIFFGIVPIVFYLTGQLRVVVPSILCVAGSLVSIAALIIFKGESIWAELRRRFYV